MNSLPQSIRDFLPRVTKTSVGVFLGFFLLIFSLGLMDRNGGNPDPNLWNVRASEHAVGPGDTSSYVKIGQYFAGVTPASGELIWRVGNWPPGYPLVIAAILKLTGESHYVLKAVIVCSSILALVFTFLFYSVHFSSNGPIRFLVWASIFALPNFRHWTLGSGLTLSEPYTLAFFLVSWTVLFLGIEKKDRRYLIIGGCLLGVTAYFRAIASVLIEGTFYTCLLILASYHLITSRIKKKYALKSVEKLNRDHHRSLKALQACGLVFLMFFCVTFPWKLRNKIRHHIFSIATNQNGSYDLQWQTDEMLAPYPFLRAANTACHIEPSLCQGFWASHDKMQPYQKGLTFFVLLSKPFRWLAFKLENINWLWTGIPWGFDSNRPFDWFLRSLEGLLYLIMGTAALIRLKGNRTELSETTRQALILHTGAFLVANIVVFLIAHFEDRYALFLRVYFFWLFLFTFVKVPRSAQVEAPL